MRARMLGLVAALLLIALVALDALDAQAEYTVVGAGIRRVLTDWTYQPTGVSELNFSGFTTYRDAGTLTVVATGGGGGGLPDGGPDNAIVRADGITGSVQASLVTIDDSGNITGPSGATVDGRDVSVDGAKLDGLPTSVVAQASVYPTNLDGGPNGQTAFVQGTVQGTGGYTYAADAGYLMPSGLCTVAIPVNQVCRVQVQWYGRIVPGIDAGNTITGSYELRRTYRIRNVSNVLTIDPLLGEADYNSSGTSAAGSAADGGVFMPWVQGVAATQTRWTCQSTTTCTVDP